MSSRFSRLSFLYSAIALCAALAACSSPVAPTVSALNELPGPLSTSFTPKHWPVQHPDGGYGHEDPAYPPEPWQCPRGWDIIYNGNNFICDDPNSYDREMPRREGYPNDWSAPQSR